MISVYRDEVKDALYRKARKCTDANRIVVAKKPDMWTASRVRKLRSSLYLSQRVFAEVLGVSLPTVVSWENSQSTPSSMACRLMALIEAYPDVLLEAGVVEITDGRKRTYRKRKTEGESEE